MAEVVSFPAVGEVELELELEPESAAGEVELEIEPEAQIEPEADPAGQALLSTALVEILPADFPLPVLARFIPNKALHQAVIAVAQQALAIDVTAESGLALADEALTLIRGQIKAVEEHLEEPIGIAYGLHKRLTGIRSDWTREGTEALRVVGARVYDESERRAKAERERVRLEQQAADAKAREEAAAEAAQAAAADAPAEVVEQLQQEAKTATAPPVARSSGYGSSGVSGLRGNTTTKTWKARIAGTPATDEPNPETADFTPAQRAQFLVLLKAIIEGKAPITAVEPNWSYLNKRAGADKTAMGIPGIEPFQQGGVRAKGGR